MKYSKGKIDLLQFIGLQKTAEQTGSNSRVVRRGLLKKYKRHFTKSEYEQLKNKTVDEINAAIDSKVGKFK